MKRIYADITSIDNPVKDGNFIEVTEFSSYNDSTYSEKIEDGFIFPLLKFDGDLQFFGKMYRVIRDLIQSGEFLINIQIYEESTLAFEGRLNLRNKLNPKDNTSSNDLVPKTIYEDILKEYNTEYNIMAVSPIYRIDSLEADRYEYQTDIIDVDTPVDAIIDPPIFPNPGILQSFEYQEDGSFPEIVPKNYTPPIPPSPSWSGLIDGTNGWTIIGMDFEPLEYLGENNGIHEIRTRTTRSMVREIRYEKYIGDQIENIPPPPWVYIEDRFVGTFKYAVFAKFLSGSILYATAWTVTGSGSIDVSPGVPITVDKLSWSTNDFNPTEAGVIQQFYTRARHLFDIIKHIIGEIDNTILFDETGSPPVNAIGGDSFYYLKNYEEETDTGTVNSMANILLEQITDAILTETFPGSGVLVEKSEQATQGLLSLNTLFSFMRDWLKIWWKLEERGNDVYFITRHESEINKVVGPSPHDFTDLLNIDWSADLTEYTHDDSKKFNKVDFKTLVANSPDFQDQTGEFHQLDLLISNRIQIKSNNFYADIEDSQIRRDQYPETGEGQFMLFATIPIRGNNLIVDYNNTGWDTLTFTLGVLTASVVTVPPASAIAWSNSIADIEDVSSGKSIILSFTITQLTIVTGELQVWIYESTNTQLITIDAVGFYSFSHTLSNDFNTTTPLMLVFIAPSGSEVSFTATPLSITADAFEIIRGFGKISGGQVLNSPLSIANIGINHWTRNLPANIFTFNGTDNEFDNDRLARDRKLVKIQVPLYTPNQLNFDQLVPVEAGDADIVEIKYYMNNKFAVVSLFLPQI